MDRYLKEIIKNLEIKENYIDNEGSYIEYIETKELNKIFNNVVSKQKVNEVIEKYFREYEKEKEYIVLIKDMLNLTKGEFDKYIIKEVKELIEREVIK